MPISSEEIREASYRKGYVHGYDAALTHMSDLSNKGYKLEQIIKMLKHFIDSILQPWEWKKNYNKQEVPPELPDL